MNIKELAEQAGFYSWYLECIDGGMDHVERFAELVAAAEREACAKICVEFGQTMNGYGCAAAIRARGDKHE